MTRGFIVIGLALAVNRAVRQPLCLLYTSLYRKTTSKQVIAMKTYDVIVAGLGTAGSAACLNLSRRGYRVLGIDPFGPPHRRGSHHGASRSVRRAYLEGTAYVPMAMRSWELWRRLERDTGQTLLVTTGNLTIGPPESPAVSGFMASARAYDIPHEVLTAAEVHRRWPLLAPPASFAAGLEKEAGIVFPEAAITAFLAEAAKAGADLRVADRLVRWTESKAGVRVWTTGASYEAGRLLVATGAWAPRLLDLPANVLSPKRVPVHWVTPPAGDAFLLGRFPVNFWQVPAEDVPGRAQGRVEFYSLPVAGSETRVKAAFHNGLADCNPDTVVRTVSQEEVQAIRTVLSRWLPALEHRPIASEVCLYTLTPDGHFYLGKRPGTENVFAVALSGHGFKFAPVLGEILADVVTGVAPSVETDLFAPDRFHSEENRKTRA
jgi:sarcosine oxidase